MSFGSFQKGIHRAREQQGPAALTLTTAPPKPGKKAPYDDVIDMHGGAILYHYRSGSPDQSDNKALRAAVELQSPLVYFWGIAPGQYQVVAPVFVTDDDPHAAMVTLELGLPFADTRGEGLVSEIDTRRYALSMVMRRYHQARFRRDVMQAYRGRCAVCALREAELIDAAHIIRDPDPEGLATVVNGIALCAIHHVAYDRNLLGIDPLGVVHISGRLLREIDGPMLQSGLQGFHEIPISQPLRENERPDPERLATRFKEFERAAQLPCAAAVRHGNGGRPMRGYVANTDQDWYEFLRTRQPAPDEINFWQPSGLRRFRAVSPGSPFFFRLKSPYNAIGGFGYFARNVPRVPAWYAWEAFGTKNGVATLDEMVLRVARYRRTEPTADGSELIGCLLVSQPVFFPRDAWVPQPANWHPNVVQGSTINLQDGEGARLIRDCLATADALGAGFELVDDEGAPMRYGERGLVAPRLGQGTFRLAVTDAYRACAVTTEHSLPVLEASHIRPYAQGGSHSVSNGILLRSDLHRLFDQGYISVSPRRELMVSDRLRREFANGRTYYQLAGSELHLPDQIEERPDAQALEWHRDVVWQG